MAFGVMYGVGCVELLFRPVLMVYKYGEDTARTHRTQIRAWCLATVEIGHGMGKWLGLSPSFLLRAVGTCEPLDFVSHSLSG